MAEIDVQDAIDDLPDPPNEEEIHSYEHAVESLHTFFQNWFTAKPSEQNFDDAIKRVMLNQRCGEKLADDFSMVTPSGAHVERESLLQNLLHAHGCHEMGFEITIENFKVLHEYNNGGNRAMVMYDEIQRMGPQDKAGTARRSTALIEKLEDGSVKWKHVHETWIEGRGPPVADGDSKK